MSTPLVGRCLPVFPALFALAPQLAAKKKPPPAPININTLNAGGLQLVSGFGPVKAWKILHMCKSHGPFKGVDDLRPICGIGPKRLEKMRKFLTVGRMGSSNRPSTQSRPRATARSALPSRCRPSAQQHSCSVPFEVNCSVNLMENVSQVGSFLMCQHAVFIANYPSQSDP